jgi:hypothetical protein
MRLVLVASLSALALPALPAAGTVLRVPESHATIQEAIDAAADGDTVLIADGVYRGRGNRDLDFRGKAIRVAGENGPERTMIDCERQGRGFIFVSGEGPDAVLSGLTIRNGDALQGGGILCDFSGPHLEDLRLEGNAAAFGGGLCAGPGSFPVLARSRFTGNAAERGGGGVLCIVDSRASFIDCVIEQSGAGGGVVCLNERTSPTFRSCLIESNAGGGVLCRSAAARFEGCTIRGNAGFAIACEEGAAAVFLNCVIAANQGSAVSASSDALATLIHATLAENQAGSAGLLSCAGGGRIHFRASILWGNRGVEPGEAAGLCAVAEQSIVEPGLLPPGPDGFSFDPLFAASGSFDFERFAVVAAGGREYEVPDFIERAGDYRLQAGSPAIDLDVGSAFTPLFDADGNGRPCGAGPDPGAYEHGGCPPPSLTVRPSPVTVGLWRRELVAVELRDTAGSPIAGAPVEFRSAYPARAWFPHARSLTGQDGIAYTVIETAAFDDPAELRATFTASSLGLDSGPVAVTGELVIADGPTGFRAPPLPPLSGRTARLAGEACGFVFPEMVGSPVSAWSIDPTVASIGEGLVTAFLEDSGCVRMEFEVAAHRPGRAVFIIGTVEYSVFETEIRFAQPFRRGDSNGDGSFVIADPINTLQFLFTGLGALPCEDAADSNDDGILNITDGVHSLAFLFLGGPPPPPPGPSECGADPTDDALGCEASPACGE